MGAEIALQHSAHVLAQVDTIITEIDEVALIAVGCAPCHRPGLPSTCWRGLLSCIYASSLCLHNMLSSDCSAGQRWYCEDRSQAGFCQGCSAANVACRIWILLRFKERLVQMAMSRSAATHATAPGASIVSLLAPCIAHRRQDCSGSARLYSGPDLGTAWNTSIGKSESL